MDLNTVNNKNQPAVILCTDESASIKVAALAVLDRLVVSIHRAGCRPIEVFCKDQLPSLKRACALGIKVGVLQKSPTIKAPTLLTAGNLLVQSSDISKIIQEKGRLVNKSGVALPIGLTSEFCSDIDKTLSLLKKVPSDSVAICIRNSISAKTAERLLWQTIVSETDGIVDKYLNRPLGRFISKALIHTPITPNQISLISMLIGLWAAYGFSKGTYTAGILGAVGLQFSAIIDCVDGDVARILFKESPFGKWLDISVDQFVHVALFAAIAIGLHRRGIPTPVGLLGISAVIGVILSFCAVLRGMLLPEERRNARLQKLIDSAATRDFSVLLLLLAVFNKLEWFLWLAGIGVHIFWITALILQYSSVRNIKFESKPTK